MTRTKLLALALASVLVLGAVGPAVAADGASLQTAGNEDDDEMDDGDDEDGNETDNSTDGNLTTPFGHQLQAYIASLENGSDNSTNSSDRPRGILIATWVVANNPGNAPDHAGPPAWAGPGGDENDSDNETQRGPPGDKRQGPPDDAERGPPGDSERGPPADEERGPPADVWTDDDEEDEDSGDSDDSDGSETVEAEEDENEEEDDDSEDGDDSGNNGNGNGGGPPSNPGGGPPGR